MTPPLMSPTVVVKFRLPSSAVADHADEGFRPFSYGGQVPSKRTRSGSSTPTLTSSASVSELDILKMAFSYPLDSPLILDGRVTPVGILGAGHNGMVYHGVLEDGRDTPVAVKVAFDRSFEDLKTIENEQRLLLKIKEARVPRVIQLISTFKDERGVRSITFEYLKAKDISTFMRDNPNYKFTLEEIQRLFSQSIETLVRLHQIGIMHCDIKPANLLLYQGKIYWIDFGSGHEFDPKDIEKTKAKSIQAGLYYKAFEVLLDLESYGPAIDVASLAYTFFEMYTGRRFFKTFYHKRVCSEPDFLASLIKSFPPIDTEMIEMIKKKSWSDDLFQSAKLKETQDRAASLNIRERILGAAKNNSESEAYADLFSDLILKMTALNPYKRISAAEALSHHPFLSEEVSSALKLKEAKRSVARAVTAPMPPRSAEVGPPPLEI